MTIQNSKIYDYLSSVKTHPTAETIYMQVRKDIPTLSLGTVYRNLNKMAEEGKVKKMEVNGQYHFDADTTIHHHFICKQCGSITDIYQKDIKKLEINAGKVQQIYIYGICRKCLRW